MAELIAFDDAQARTYRKRTEVLAFRSQDPIHFHKSWGDQDLRAGGWVVVPLTEDGSVTQDVYGVDEAVFADTYEPSPSLRPNRFRKKETARAYQPGFPFEVETVLADGHREVKASASDSYDTWIVRGKGGEAYPVANPEFLRTYAEVVERADTYRIRSRDDHWRADGGPKRILALDGGGVRGILTLGYLERVERILAERHRARDTFRLSHYFDLIAGTSTGAIIAAFLAQGYRVADVVKLYQDLAGTVFKPNPLRRGICRARYSAKHIAEVLADKMPQMTLGSPSVQTGLLVVAKRLDTGSVWPMNNNPAAPFFSAGPKDDFLANADYPLREVVRASAAAPSYFSPVRIRIHAGGASAGRDPLGEFVDGGVSPHNNPAFLALQVVGTHGFGAKWVLDPDKLLLVSVGTGSSQPGVSHSLLPGKHAIKAVLSLMDDAARSVETVLQWLSSSPTARPVDAVLGDLGRDLLAERPLMQYLRYNVRLDSGWLKDNLRENVSPNEVKDLKKLDRAASLPRLLELGRRAAELQIREEHFPAGFDLT